MVNVICMKWGDKYGPHYVNILRAMVRRRLARPHRFVCFTDNATGLHRDVEVFPIPELDLPSGIPERCWRKLLTFERQLGDLEGTTLFLDLDVVVVGSLDAYFDVPGDFLIAHDYRWYGRRRVIGNSSCYRFEVGETPEVIDYFRDNMELIRATHRHEQAYLSHKMLELGKLQYWPTEWCRSFKAHCLPKLPLRYAVPPAIPHGARVVIFHGDPNPPDAAPGRFSSLRKFWRPCPWVLEHWHDHDADGPPTHRAPQPAPRTMGLQPAECG